MKTFSLIIALFAVTFAAVGIYAKAQKATIHESPHKVLKRSCEKCHVATSFSDIRFDHDETNFALGTAHAQVKCLDCHSVENFAKVESACASCHTDVHREQMGPRCERCHVGDSWSVFDSEAIHASTNFPIMGRHVMLDCESCHAGMPIERFRQTPSQCIGCHRADYERVQSPNHVGSGFSTECQTCHQMTAWVPATMTDHDAIFPIFSGTHNRVWTRCTECHPNPSNMRVVNCLGCHEQPVMDPVHSGFPGYSYATPACLTCHPRGERGNFANHDAVFPIYSGTHNNVWSQCAECHPNPANRAQADCLGCHEHDQPLMDPVHNGFNGYSYTTAACLNCHPRGEKGRFAEHEQFFPIYSGVHSNWNSCTACHPTPADKTIFSCFQCHNQRDMDDKHRGEQGYSYNSAECLRCHPRGRKN